MEGGAVRLFPRNRSQIWRDRGVGAFILFMLFIIGEIAWKSKAGKTGTFVLFFVLAFGMVGFIAKGIIQNSGVSKCRSSIAFPWSSRPMSTSTASASATPSIRRRQQEDRRCHPAVQPHLQYRRPEVMEGVGGSCRVKLQGESAWKTLRRGQSFDVPGNFQLRDRLRRAFTTTSATLVERHAVCF